MYGCQSEEDLWHLTGSNRKERASAESTDKKADEKDDMRHQCKQPHPYDTMHHMNNDKKMTVDDLTAAFDEAAADARSKVASLQGRGRTAIKLLSDGFHVAIPTDDSIGCNELRLKDASGRTLIIRVNGTSVVDDVVRFDFDLTRWEGGYTSYTKGAVVCKPEELAVNLRDELVRLAQPDVSRYTLELGQALDR